MSDGSAARRLDAVDDPVIAALGDLQASLWRSYFRAASERDGASQLQLKLAQISAVASANGRSELAVIVEQLLGMVASLGDNAGVSDEMAAYLEDWAQLCVRYLHAPREDERWLALVDFLNTPYWGELPAAADDVAAARSGETLTASIADEARASGDVARRAERNGGDASFVAMIKDELQGCAAVLEASLSAVVAAASRATEDAASADVGAPLSDYRWQVERLADAAQSLGLNGLHDALARVAEASELMANALPQEIPGYCATLTRWPGLTLAYLDEPGDIGASTSLAAYLSAVDFPLPLEEQEAQALLDRLCAPTLSSVASVAARPTLATPEMTSLKTPDDINGELLDSLLSELPGQMEEFSASVQRMAGGSGDMEAVHSAQRIAHTIKGAANTVGVRGIAEFAHHLEDIFTALEQAERSPSRALGQALVETTDCMEAMCEALMGLGPAPMQAVAVLQTLLDIANRLDEEGVGALEAAPAPAVIPESHADVQPAQMQEQAVRNAESQPAETAASLRVATAQIDELLRLSGESKIVGSQLKEGMRRVASQLQAARRQNELLQQLVNELEQLVDVRGVAALGGPARVAGFDALEMDQYGELHYISRRLAEAALDSREWNATALSELDGLEDLMVNQARQHNEAQDAILRMRMVPASAIVGRLQRGVRQTCRLLDKEVDLEIKGAETLIDAESLNQLIDPLMHLVRNAIDHGVEAAEARLAKGKPAQGKLSVEFGREANRIVVRCLDDGKGLDHAAIRATGVARGLIAADEQLTEAQLARLILEPGFSTRAEVTQVSGRGIGLDVVYTRVLELKGSMDVESQRDRGCRFTINLPAALISMHALLVRQERYKVALATRGVVRIVDGQSVKPLSVDGKLCARIDDVTYEAHRIETLLAYPPDRRATERTARPALLVDAGADGMQVVLLQNVLDTVDIVIKPLGPFVPRSAGLIGATILGDGSVAPVVDLPDLVRGARASDDSQTSNAAPAAGKMRRQSGRPRLPFVLVVDDSVSVRRSMELLLRDAGYDVRAARDGMEAMNIVTAKKPDIMLVDMEMPRMNGLELTARVRHRPETRDMPVIMITSRSTDKHRQEAARAGVSAYMTKPYLEGALLAQIGRQLRAAQQSGDRVKQN